MSRGSTPHRLLAACLASVLLWGLSATPANAAKEVVAYFGTESGSGELGGQFGRINGQLDDPRDVAVNWTGAGPADRGDIYVVDSNNNRIQRFAQADQGTPYPYDDEYVFLDAWGADVDSTPAGGTDYEICSVAADCKTAVESSGNGTLAGNGGLSDPRSVSVDQDTGDVYVVDAASRVLVYDGEGSFLRSFGWDVVQSGPGDVGTGYEVCVPANGDVCKAGVSGAGLGQIGQGAAVAVSQGNGEPGVGTVFVADPTNTRVDTFSLDGSGPASFGSSAQLSSARLNQLAVDSRGIVYIADFANGQEIDRYDSQNANGGGVGFLAPIPVPPLVPPNNSNGTVGLEVDPDSDGAGTDTDVLFALRTYSDLATGTFSVVQQLGPVNAPGLTAPPGAVDETHGTALRFNFARGLGLDPANGRLFVTTFANVGGPYNNNGPGTKAGVYVLDKAGGPPSATLDALDTITATSAKVHATVHPNGGPTVSYRLEYSTDGVSWASTAETVVGAQETPQSVETTLDLAGEGLLPGTLYHVRLVATKAFAAPVVTAEKTFTTLPSAPFAETTGSPLRTALTARLEGRVAPRGSATTYRFEYGTQGPCSAEPCQQTDPLAAGSSRTFQFVSQLVGGLEPATTYHYRLVADNGNPGSPVFGEDMTMTTRASDEPLEHGDFPGPPGSDRAWEQVNVPETGGNPVLGGQIFSDDGERAVYQIPGGTPHTDSGSAFNQFFAERTPSGWISRPILPSRDQLIGPNFTAPFADGELSTLFVANANATTGQRSFWRLSPGAAPVRLHDSELSEDAGFIIASDDGSRNVGAFKVSLDPAHPVVADTVHLYDLSSGSPQLLSLLPGNSVSACGVMSTTLPEFRLPENAGRRPTHWLSADGSLLVFPSKGNDCESSPQLYLRDIPASQTTRISGTSVSGPSCGAAFAKQTPQAIFFWTQARLVAEDTLPGGCNNEEDGDVYRYEIASGALECVTCVIAGLDVDADPSTAVANDGSRVYFESAKPLILGAPENGAYRIDVDSGDLAFVAPWDPETDLSDTSIDGNAINPDGSVFVFRSASPAINPLNGLQDGGTAQYYRYDDRDRSLVCVSCPRDGTAPSHAASTALAQGTFFPEVGPNGDPLNDDGRVFVFATPVPLVGGDQNTSAKGDPALGTDVYEWRDGRVLLITDGLTRWPHREVVPIPNGVSPSGRDVFFTASAQYTPDAPDSYTRLYDARIGGGIEFPVPPPPCPLEVCQGTPKGAPPASRFGSESYVGPGNVSTAPARSRCAKGKVRRRGRCVRKRVKGQRARGAAGRRAQR